MRRRPAELCCRPLGGGPPCPAGPEKGCAGDQGEDPAPQKLWQRRRRQEPGRGRVGARCRCRAQASTVGCMRRPSLRSRAALKQTLKQALHRLPVSQAWRNAAELLHWPAQGRDASRPSARSQRLGCAAAPGCRMHPACLGACCACCQAAWHLVTRACSRQADCEAGMPPAARLRNMWCRGRQPSAVPPAAAVAKYRRSHPPHSRLLLSSVWVPD